MARRRDIIGVLDATGSGFITNSVTVTTTATPLPTTTLKNRKAISIRNYSSSVNIFVGDSGVTAASGYPVLPYESLPFNMSDGANLYAITESGSADVRVIEVDNA